MRPPTNKHTVYHVQSHFNFNSLQHMSASTIWMLFTAFESQLHLVFPLVDWVVRWATKPERSA